MVSKATVFWSAFAGKVVAAIFVAVCVILGFGPEQWVTFLIDGLPLWMTPALARVMFILLAVLTVILLIFSWSTNSQPQETENEDHWTERKQV